MSRSRIAADPLGVVGRQPIGLFRTTTCRSRRGSQSARKSSCSDRVVILLGVRDPHDRIDAREDRLDALAMGALESSPGPAGRGWRRPRAPRPGDREPWPFGTPSQSSRPARPGRLAFGTQASGWAVVGRRTEASLTDDPARALSRLDLPTPVPPTMGQDVGVGGEPEPLRYVTCDRARLIGRVPSVVAAGARRPAAGRHGPSDWSPVVDRAQSGSAGTPVAVGDRRSATLIGSVTRRRRPPDRRRQVPEPRRHR